MIFLADLPKPLHGMSNVNQQMLNVLKKSNAKVIVINTAPSYGAAFFKTKRWAVLKVFHTLLCALRLILALVFSGERAVYRPIYGGFGQVYDVLYLGILQIFRCKIVIHHHSFEYLHNRKRLFAKTNQVAGTNAIHLVLGDAMRDSLTKYYGIPGQRIIKLSNLAFFEQDGESIRLDDHQAPWLGHLANLCDVKGIDVVDGLCRRLAQDGVDFHARIAGPFADEVARVRVLSLNEDLQQVDYLGPVYDDAKDVYYGSLDIFIFFSKYVSEAEPLVLYEAGQQGCYIIGSNRGCMGSMINDLQGLSLDWQSAPIEAIVGKIQQLAQSGALTYEARLARAAHFNQLQRAERAALDEVIGLF